MEDDHRFGGHPSADALLPSCACFQACPLTGCEVGCYGACMVYARAFVRLQVIGTHYADEVFTWGLNFAQPAGQGASAPETVPQGVIDALAAFHGAPRISNKAVIRTVKLNPIDVEGHYVSQGQTVLTDLTTPIAGTGTGAPLPPQVALAITLRTWRRRGPGSTGRFYVPSPTTSLGDDGRLTVAGAEAWASAAATMINSLEAAIPGFTCVVASQGGAGGSIAPAHLPVQEVLCGRVLDVQQRRRNNLEEAHELATTQLTQSAHRVGGFGGDGSF